MTAVDRVFSRRSAFKAWLKRLPPETTFARGCCGCPLAVFAKARGVQAAVFGSWYSVGNIRYDMPKWAERFVNLHDAKVAELPVGRVRRIIGAMS